MKILHTADWHVGKSLRGRSRAEEHRRVLAELAELAGREEVDLVLVAGDLFDSSSPSPESETIVYRALLDLRHTGATVVLVAGNHDNPRRLEAVAPLLDLGGLVTAPFLRPAGQGGLARVETRSGEEASLVLLPFLSQRHIVRADELMGLDADQHEQRYARRMEQIVHTLGEALGDDAVNLVVAHLMVAGGVLGGGERSAHTIFEYSVPASVFTDLGLHYAALGHLHRCQRIPASCPAWYPGSPLQLDFGEEGNQPSVLLVEASPGLPAEVEQVEVTEGRRLRTLEGSLEELEAVAGEVGDDYLRVVVRGDRRAGLGDLVRELLPDAVDVVAVRPDEEPGRRRAPRLGRPPRELFAEYLEQAGASDERLLALFDQLLDEVHASDQA